MTTPILQQGRVLIASLQVSQSDSDLRSLHEELLAGVARHRATGVILDVSAVEVMDSYAVRTVRSVAYAMTQLGITMEGIATALDLDDGLSELRRDRELEPAERH